MARLSAAILVALCSLATGFAAAQSEELPALTAVVNDFAGVIDAQSAADITRWSEELRRQTGDAVVVVTVKTFAPYGSIEDYAVKLFEKARVGQKGKDNGILILLAVSERKARIEVGYGLEGTITDGYAGDTLRQAMFPEFRNGRFGAGMLAGATRIIDRLASSHGITLTGMPAPRAQRRESGSGGTPTWLIVLAVLAFLAFRFLSPALFSGGRGRWGGWGGGVGGFGGGWGGGGFGGGDSGGGGGSFGGGSSGGGGASGDF